MCGDAGLCAHDSFGQDGYFSPISDPESHRAQEIVPREYWECVPAISQVLGDLRSVRLMARPGHYNNNLGNNHESHATQREVDRN